METSIERLKKVRKSLRGTTTRLMNQALKTLEEHPERRDSIEETLVHLREKKENIIEMDKEIQRCIPDAELEQEMESRERYREKVTSCIFKLERHLQRENRNSRDENTSSSGKQISVKLPKLVIDKFNGDPSKWQCFWSQFSTAIHKNEHLSKVDKFNYLKSFLESAALSSINGLSLSDENYDVAIKLLTERFGREDLVVGAHMEKMLRISPVKRSSDIKNLRHLYDTCEVQVRSLESMSINTDSYGTLLCPLLLKLIPSDLALEFNRKKDSADSRWNVKDLLSLIRQEVEARERTELLSRADERANDYKPGKFNSIDNSSVKKKNEKVTLTSTTSTLHTGVEDFCLYCHATDHSGDNCQVKTLNEKKDILKRQGRCFNCLKRCHLARFCRKRTNCPLCNRRHHTSICDSQEGNSETEKTIVASVSNEGKSNNFCYYLQTVQVLAKGENSNIKTRCLFDTGSQRSFIRGDISRRLNLKVKGTETITVYTFGTNTPKKLTCRRVLVPLAHVGNSELQTTIEALEMPVLSTALVQIPGEDLQQKLIDGNFELSDEPLTNSNSTEPLGILIGTDFYWTVVTGQTKRLGESLVALETLFGWSLHGPIATPVMNLSVTVMKAFVDSNDNEIVTNAQISKFWELESLGIVDSNANDSELNAQVLKQFESDLSYQNERYEIRLPWKDGKRDLLSDNYQEAKNRFTGLVRRFKKGHTLYELYNQVIQEYLRDQIVENAEGEEGKLEYFLPHRAVIRQDRITTKVRPVFDASSHEKGQLSLNDCLHTGPNLNPELFELLLKFRQHRIALIADIEKAFLQIKLSEEDRNVTKFLWVDNLFDKNSEPNYRTLRFTRIVFGINSSPFLLAAVIRHHLQKFIDDYPETCKVLDESMYVDDLISGADNTDEALKLKTESSKIMKTAGMTLRKWNTNCNELAREWEKDEHLTDTEDKQFTLPCLELKVLGLKWNPSQDNLSFDVSALLEFLTNRLKTKRFILQASGRIYDPLGFLTPYTIIVKCMFQELWVAKIGWDEPLPNDIELKWDDWCQQLPKLSAVKIPRYYLHSLSAKESQHLQLHCFCDASTKAFGTVLYLRIVSDSKIRTALVCAKSRVAPLKILTLPRLELMAALLGSRLLTKVQKILKIENVFLWTDSQIALYWIKGDQKRYSAFVCNRVAEIQASTNIPNWFHCPGKTNPADLVSRGQRITNLLANELWWNGPAWLVESPENWPKQENVNVDTELDIAELRKSKPLEIVSLSANVKTVQSLMNLEKFSSLWKILRITAWILRFVSLSRKLDEKCGPLSAAELQLAEKFWIRVTQQNIFNVEIRALKEGKPLQPTSKLLGLNPYLDEDDILRVGGRLNHAEITFNQKHPIILPPNSRFTELVIDACHQKTMHGGIATTLSQARGNFWIQRGRQAVKKVLRNCKICLRFSAKPANEITAQLPKERIQEAKAFQTVGLDFAGPLYTKTKNGSEKSYIALFTCAVTRAVHLELISNLSADTFLLALRRFLARRGICSKIYTDNAKTFKRAEKELSKIWNSIKSPEVQNLLSKEKIVWCYITERASWWGGFWERLVRSVKTCLRKHLGKALLNFEELTTILTEVEAVLNSRPLTYCYNDIDEPEPITPAQFLTGSSSLILPPHTVPDELKSSTAETLTRRKKYREDLLRRIWSQWRKQYLLDLRSAHNLSSLGIGPKVRENDLVLIHDEKLPRHMWRVGRVMQIFQGRDGKIRSCLVKTRDSTLRRPVQLLYPLELC